jgi:hypothetical protein
MHQFYHNPGARERALKEGRPWRERIFTIMMLVAMAGALLFRRTPESITTP